MQRTAERRTKEGGTTESPGEKPREEPPFPHLNLVLLCGELKKLASVV